MTGRSQLVTCTKHDIMYASAGGCPLCSQEQAGFTAGGVPDVVNHPPHYKQGEIECIDAIRAALTEEEFRGYCKGNALKYIWRERHKGNKVDIDKAGWYLDKLQQS